MGHRAHYAIRRDGQVRLHYAHWGARTVPEDVFFGPHHTAAFLARLEPARVWLDDTWAEGGAAIDHDQRALAFFGGDVDEDLIEAWLSLLRALWPGWSVRWVDGIPDLAILLGVDPEPLRGDAWARPGPPPPLPSQGPLSEVAPRIWDHLSRVEARKDVLHAHARQTLGGLPPGPVYGEDPTGHPQFLMRVPSSWPGPVAAEAAFTFAHAVAAGEPAEELGQAAFRAAVDAEEPGLSLDLLDAWGALGAHVDNPAATADLAKGLTWLVGTGMPVGPSLAARPTWRRWALALADLATPSADALLARLRETA